MKFRGLSLKKWLGLRDAQMISRLAALKVKVINCALASACVQDAGSERVSGNLLKTGSAREPRDPPLMTVLLPSLV